jgi:hypothetical protein
MGQTTYTGPIRAGTILNTTGTTLGQDVANVGYVKMSQTALVNQATNVAVAGLYKTGIVIPAGSQITAIRLFKTTAWDGAAQTINVGTSTTATELAVAANNDAGTTLGLLNVIPGDDATRTQKWLDVGTSDVQIYVLSTNTGGGVGRLEVEYVQARDLL